MRFLKIFVFLFFFFIFCRPVVADLQKFETKFNLTYKIHEDGKAIVTENFELKNLTTEYYPSEYIVYVNDANISQLRAYDQKGTLNVSLIDKQKIRILFRDALAGIGKVYSFSIVYESSDIAKRVGRIWSINIPRPAEASKSVDFNIGVYVPDSFGQLVYTTPQVNSLFWDKSSFKGDMISVVFDPIKNGDVYQSYDFNLKYHLYNSRLYPISTTIALPPDTSHQKIFLKEINPRPIDVKLDESGNWLAEFRLGPASSIDITATGSAAVFLKPIANDKAKGVLAGFIYMSSGNGIYKWREQSDFNHLVFAIQTKENYPIPAGLYKVNTILGQKNNDVEVIPSTSGLDINMMPNIGLRVEIPKQVTAGWQIGGKIFVDNLGPTIFSGEKIKVSSDDFDVVEPSLYTGIMPPFASREMDVTVRPSQWFREINGIIRLEINGEIRDYKIKVSPIYKSNFVLIVGILIIFGIISIIAQIARGLSLQRRK